MKKLAVFAGVFGAIVAVVLVAKKNRSAESLEAREERRGEKRSAMFARMREGMDAMPEDFPPRVMFDNLAATRENSERILAILEGDSEQADKPIAAAR